MPTHLLWLFRYRLPLYRLEADWGCPHRQECRRRGHPLGPQLAVSVPHPCRCVVRLCVGLGISLTAPEEALFPVARLFLPVGHLLPLPFWDSALAAAVFEAALVRPSLKTLLAAVAALLLVCLLLADMVLPFFTKAQEGPLGVAPGITGCYTGPNPCSVLGISREDIHPNVQVHPSGSRRTLCSYEAFWLPFQFSGSH